MSFVFAIGMAGVACGEEANAPTVQTPLVLRSSRFVLHTDLPRVDAERAMARMEAAIKCAARYWKSDPRGQIHCYLVQDLNVWSDAAFPHKLARIWVGGVGGATISEFVMDRGKTRVSATVYADAMPGVVEHEVIHAYCYQTFGTAGPDWYKEGMAQSVSKRSGCGTAGGCPLELAGPLGNLRPKEIREIVRAGNFSKELHDSFCAMLAKRENAEHCVSLIGWSQQDTDRVNRLESEYLWSWSLCHLLLHNSNYSNRFRALGERYMADGEASFDRAFGGLSNEVAFEYEFFLQRMIAGYRVDLCRWDWSGRFRTPEQQRTISQRIEAVRGFQPAGLQVTAGRSYDYITQGQWAVGTNAAFTDANGGEDGAGRMVGTVMTNFKLSQPFDLGVKGAFVAPSSGNLYVRCRDGWGELGDNHGEILLRFTRPGGKRS